MRQRVLVIVRLFAVVSGLLFVCLVTVRLLLAYQIHRTFEMLAAIQRLNVGDSEDSIKPLLKHFGGYRSVIQLGALEDYNCVLEINPWRFQTLTRLKSSGRDEPIGIGLNAGFRRAAGFRYWMVMSEIAVKQHRVIAVQADTHVEGRTMWLGTLWRLSEKPREFQRDPTAEYLQWPPEPDLDFVSPAILEMGTGGGTSWAFWVKPTSPAIQRHVADRWNFGCFDSFRGCDSLCNLLPEAAPYFKEHSELAPKGGGWNDSSRSCKHDPYEGRY